MMGPGVNLNRVQLFLDIVRIGSITKTAETLNLQKSKVSRDLTLLEQELGTQLIYRTTRQFNLTADGQKFYEKAKESLQLLNYAINETSTKSQLIDGLISITCPEDIGQFFLIPLLDEFSKIYPKVTFKIEFSSEIVDVVKNKIDLAIRPGKLRDSSLKMKKIGKVEFSLYCTSSLYETLPNIESTDQLKELPTIYFQNDLKKPQWNLSHNGKVKKIEINPYIRVNSFLAAYELVKRGLGIALLPNFIVTSDLAKGEIVPILKEYHSGSADIQIIYPQKNESITRVKILSDFIIKKMNTFF
ncbi:MAG: LysR family transcriptional regulator [Bdellovibrionales bacterium]|nr:LysR family transcriptional regulator [Bdellovibrionales bacterium]